MKKKIIAVVASIGIICATGAFFFGCSNAAEADYNKQANTDGTQNDGDQSGGAADQPTQGGSSDGGDAPQVSGEDMPQETTKPDRQVRDYVTLEQAIEIITNLKEGETAEIKFSEDGIQTSDLVNSESVKSRTDAQNYGNDLQKALVDCNGKVTLDFSKTNITVLGSYALSYCASITGVVLPDCLTEIGD